MQLVGGKYVCPSVPITAVFRSVQYFFLSQGGIRHRWKGYTRAPKSASLLTLMLTLVLTDPKVSIHLSLPPTPKVHHVPVKVDSNDLSLGCGDSRKATAARCFYLRTLCAPRLHNRQDARLQRQPVGQEYLLVYSMQAGGDGRTRCLKWVE